MTNMLNHLSETKLDLSSLTIVHHNLHWQTLKYVKYGDPIKGMDKFKGIEDATAACIKNPACTAVYNDYKAHKFSLMTGTTQVPHTSSREFIIDFFEIFSTSHHIEDFYCNGQIWKTQTSLIQSTLTLDARRWSFEMIGTLNNIHHFSGVISSIKRLPCGDGKCQGIKSGKVVTIDMKHCYKIRTMEIYNKQICCSKSGGNVVVSKTQFSIRYQQQL